MALTAALQWPPGDSEMAQRVRAHDWAATPLGSLETWPERLRAAGELVIASPQVASLAIGPERLLLYNDVAAQLFGTAHPSVLGRSLAEAFPESYPDVAPFYDLAFAGDAVTVPARPVSVSMAGGEVFEATLLPVRSADGEVLAVLMTGSEVSARWRAEAVLRENEARQAFLLALGDALRAQSSTRGLIETAARMLGEHLNASRIMFADFHDDRGVVDIFHGWFADGAKPFPTVMRLEEYEGPILDDFRAGRTVQIEDTLDPALARPDLAAIAELGVKALLSVPLVVDGRLVVNLSVHQHTARHWTNDEVSLVQEVAERLWADLVRARTEAALRKSDTRFRALVTAGTHMIYRINPDWSEMIELRGNDMLADAGEPFMSWAAAYLLPEDQPMILGRIKEAIRTKSLFELEHRVRQADGGIGWVLSRAVPILGEHGEILEWFGTGSDITARREMDERLRETEARYRSDLERQVRERTAELMESRDLLQATMDSSMDMVQVFKAVRNESGEIVDFRWMLNNHTSESRYGRIEGESLLERNPGVIVEGIFDTFRRVTETGKPEQAERHYTHEQFDGWFLQSVVKLGDGVATTTKEITEWKAAQAELLRLKDAVAQTRLRQSQDALRDSEARFRTIVETARDHAIFTTDVEGRIETWPAGAQAVLGWSAEEAIGQPVDITFTPEDRAERVPEKEKQKAREQGHASDVRWHLRKDGALVFIEGVTRPLTGSDGTFTGFLKVGQDVTERRATEAALQESEARFRQFGEASADVLWIRDCKDLAFEYVSPSFETVYGARIEDVLGGNHIRRWIEMIVPEDREKTLEAVRRVRGGETVLHCFRVLHGDGQIRWIRNTDFPLVDAEGRVQRIGGIAHDATEEVEMQDRLQVLVAELQHRSRNLVGVTQAITERTLATSETLEEFRGRFRPRLDALGRVNGLLSRLEEGDRISFDQLLQTELAAHGILGGEDNGTAISLQGPMGIRLRSATVQTFALALHELTTNALKYGALASAGGQLQVTWRLVPGKGKERRLRVDWSETTAPAAEDEASRKHLLDGQPVASRRGYGRELIELALPYQLKAETSYELTAEGVRCTIIVPVSTTLDVAFSSQEDPHD